MKIEEINQETNERLKQEIFKRDKEIKRLNKIINSIYSVVSPGYIETWSYPIKIDRGMMLRTKTYGTEMFVHGECPEDVVKYLKLKSLDMISNELEKIKWQVEIGSDSYFTMEKP